jgi:4-amino-4-deoxy-L-arabinose transferase-like glycosyltransferase
MRIRVPLTAALIVLAVAALALRVLSIAEPLGIDQSLWASAVRGMARHQLLYRDVWEQRPPGIYVTYLAGFRLFGWTPAAVAWMDILASTATTLLLFGSVRRLSAAPTGCQAVNRESIMKNGPDSVSQFTIHCLTLNTPTTTGAFAAALYATLTMPGWLYRHDGFLERSVCETFIVVCVGLAAYCAVRWRERPSINWAAAVGLFGGAAVVFKPNAGLYLPAVLVWMWCYRQPSVSLAETGRSFVAAAIAAAIVPMVTVLWLWRLDLIADARVAVLDFNRFYVSQGLTIHGYAVDFSKTIWLRMKTDPLWLAGGVGSLVVAWELARRRTIDALAGLAVLWGGAAALVIVVNGARLFNTYFIQAFAPLAVLAAWLLVARARSLSARTVSIATAALMLTLLVQRHYVARVYQWVEADYAALRGTLDRSTYLDRFGGYGNDRGYSARANEELATYVRDHTSSDDRIFLFGINGAGVYFLADRLTAHRFLRVNFFVPSDFPNPDFTLEAVVADLSARRPRYLIFEELHSSSEMGRMVDALPSRDEVKRLLEAYRLETTIEDFSLYRLSEPGASESR